MLRCLNNVATIPNYPPYNVTIYIDNIPLVTLQYKEVSPYMNIDNLSHTININMNNSFEFVSQLGSYFTLIVTGDVRDERTIQSSIYNDNLNYSDSYIRLIHSAYNIPELICYIDTHSKILQFEQESEYMKHAPGPVICSASNNDTQIINPNTLNIIPKMTYTLVVSGTKENAMYLILYDKI